VKEKSNCEEKMIRINFAKEEIEKLRYERFNHPHPRVQIKMEALLLKSQGLKHKQIGKILGICQDTLRGYFEQYMTGGVEALKELNFYKPKTEMEDYRDTIEDEFRRNPPATVKEASARIKELTGIERSEVQVGKFLKKIRIKTLKGSPNTCKSRYRKAG
jgi:transposase